MTLIEIALISWMIIITWVFVRVIKKNIYQLKLNRIIIANFMILLDKAADKKEE